MSLPTFSTAILKVFCCFLLCTFLSGCDDPYTPKAIVNPDELLVVEGFIDVGDTSVFKLSKTRKLSESNIEQPVDWAGMVIEGEDNTAYPVNFIGNGTYKSEGASLNPIIRYRVRIFLTDGRQYLSDFVETKTSPPIDTVTWEAQSDGVQLYVDTHDPAANSRYYLWSFEETWMFRTPFISTVIDDGSIRPRIYPQEAIPNECYANAVSTRIMLGNSTALSEDIVYENPFYKVALTSNRLKIKYSILVKQYVLTKEAFAFWEGMKKIADNMGSLFAVQPYQLPGNITQVGGQEKVIGFISAGSKTTRRIFIDKTALPSYNFTTIFDGCTENIDDMGLDYSDGSIIPLGRFPDPNWKGSGPPPSVLLYSYKQCVDCRVNGNVAVPPFWQ